MHSFEGVEARRVGAGLYGVAVLLALWAFRTVAPRAWFAGRFRTGYLRLSFASFSAGLIILFPPWRLASSWPILALYFLPASLMVLAAATHRLPDSKRKEWRGKLAGFCLMGALIICAIGEGDSFATGAVGLAACVILFVHREKLNARRVSPERPDPSAPAGG